MRSLVARSREVVWGVKLACPASQVLQVMGKVPDHLKQSRIARMRGVSGS